jgi:hypothetical protein
MNPVLSAVIGFAIGVVIGFVIILLRRWWVP